MAREKLLDRVRRRHARVVARRDRSLYFFFPGFGAGLALVRNDEFWDGYLLFSLVDFYVVQNFPNDLCNTDLSTSQR